jgi:DNA gyrase subunit A
MIINKSGVIIRTPVSELRVQGRATQGVKLIDLKGKDSIASVTKVEKEELDESDVEMPVGEQSVIDDLVDGTSDSTSDGTTDDKENSEE